jgi:hypothetical protein
MGKMLGQQQEAGAMSSSKGLDMLCLKRPARQQGVTAGSQPRGQGRVVACQRDQKVMFAMHTGEDAPAITAFDS